MYELYWSQGSAAVVPQAVLEEIGAPYRLRKVDLAAGEQHRPEFLALNPFGYVPVLVDGKTVLSETAAIVLYLCDKHPEAGLAPKAGSPDRAAFYRWLVFLANTMQTTLSRQYAPGRYTARPDQAAGVREKADENLDRYWQTIDDTLAAAGPYLLGDKYSACDAYMWVLGTWQDPPGSLLPRFANLRRCVDLVTARPAIGKLIESGAV